MQFKYSSGVSNAAHIISISRYEYDTMSLVRRFLLCGALLFSSCLSEQPPSLDGIHNFANRLFDGQADSFFFELTGDHKLWSRWNQPVNDNYTVFEDGSGKIRVQGTTVNALARGYV